MSKTRKREQSDDRKQKVFKEQKVRKIKNFKQFIAEEADEETFDYNIKGLK